LGCAVAFAALSLNSASANTKFKVLHSFAGMPSDGSAPYGGVIRDESGNLYGTTTTGGGVDRGVVYKLAPDGTETILFSFCPSDCSGGAYPRSDLIADSEGNLYGTTTLGGDVSGCPPRGTCGTVFKLAPNGTETVLADFDGNTGDAPYAGLIMDRKGNLYGTTVLGGNYDQGSGTVFRLKTNGTLSDLHVFNGSDGSDVYSKLLRDHSGNLYGTAQGGSGASYYGTVFKIASDGTESTLYTFKGGSDAWWPFAGLIADSSGNLYGTTAFGGANGDGTVFKLAPDGSEAVLYSFDGKTGGARPMASLLADKAGNFYGTTLQGGNTGCTGGMGCGTVFELAPDGTETVLHTFTGGTDGGYPYAALTKDKKGNLYGTTELGGTYGEGTVFRIKTLP
jgi:uncharacterized repeat protein (TIGR03803 family)